MQIGTLTIRTFTALGWEDLNPIELLPTTEIHLWRINTLPGNDQSSIDACQPLLRHYLGSDIEIKKNPQGKPIVFNLSGELSPVQFNLSHTKDLFTIGFVQNHHLGIDVESLRPERPWKTLAKRFFDPAEVTQLEQTPSAQQEDLFYQFWTLKESMIKCLGLSIFTGLPRAKFNTQTNPISLLAPSTEDHLHQFFHFKDTHYFSIAVTPFANDSAD